ncbi:MAG: MipA/OmpV family protein [Pseudomonadota bacterium]
MFSKKILAPKAGFQDVAFGINWNHAVNKEWSVVTKAGVSHLLGDASRSPLTLRKTSPALLVTANYKFF